MLPSSFRRALCATPFLAAITVVVGCNTLLDNRPGDLRSDVSEATPDPESDPRGGAERDGGASGSSAPQPSTDREDDDTTDAGSDAGIDADSGADAGADAAPLCNVTLVTSCGACGVVCPASPHYQPTCTAGVCAGACMPGFADCNADPSDGCETNLLNERVNCGQCGRVCIIGKCKAGTCVWQP
jgi:hypothetical protein